MDCSINFFLQKYEVELLVKSNVWICTELPCLEQCSENGLGKQYYWFDQYVANKTEGVTPI